MNRLGRSFKAFLRKAQMSRYDIFVFVEGDKVDPYFYDEITKSVCSSTNTTYQICRSYEFDGERGGKDILISYYRYLRSKSALIDSFKGKKTLSVFYLDKDIDDLLRKKALSPHVVYTKNYDAESHVFVNGDLTRAVATATSITIDEATNLIGNQQHWHSTVTNLWKEWIKICIFVAKKNIGNIANYRVPSRINQPVFNPTNQALYLAQLASVKNDSNLTNVQFSRAYRRVSNFVDQVFDRGEQDTIFKGKWFVNLLEATIRSNIRHRNLNGVGERVASTVLLTLDFDAPWADHFKDPLITLIRSL